MPQDNAKQQDSRPVTEYDIYRHALEREEQRNPGSLQRLSRQCQHLEGSVGDFFKQSFNRLVLGVGPVQCRAARDILSH